MMTNSCPVSAWLLEKQGELNLQVRGATGEVLIQFMQLQCDLGASGRRHEVHCIECQAWLSKEPSAFPDLLEALEDAYDREDELDRMDEGETIPEFQSGREMNRSRHSTRPRESVTPVADDRPLAAPPSETHS
jgi:hypothetical protein